MRISITGSGTREIVDSLEEAILIVTDWYDFLSDEYPDVELPIFNPDGKKIRNFDTLVDLAYEWQDNIADACGIEKDSNDDQFCESAAEQMGLDLNFEEIYDDEKMNNKDDDDDDEDAEDDWKQNKEWQ